MEKLLSDVTPDRDTVFRDLVAELRDGLTAPVFFGSTANGNGVRRLLARHAGQPTRSPAQLSGAYVMKISHAGRLGKRAYARVFGSAL